MGWCISIIAIVEATAPRTPCIKFTRTGSSSKCFKLLLLGGGGYRLVLPPSRSAVLPYLPPCKDGKPWSVYQVLHDGCVRARISSAFYPLYTSISHAMRSRIDVCAARPTTHVISFGVTCNIHQAGRSMIKDGSFSCSCSSAGTCARTCTRTALACARCLGGGSTFRC